MIMSQWILYHVLSHAECAEVRRKIVELGVAPKVRFRNIDISEEATRDLIALVGSPSVPCLKTDDRVFLGGQRIVEFLMLSHASTTPPDESQ